MKLLHDQDFVVVISVVLGLLILSSLIGVILKRRVTSENAIKVVNNLNARTKAWWIMCVALFLAIGTGGAGSILLFAFTSFMALREFITLTPTRKADHRTLFWAFFIITPIHYYLLWTHWYGMFSIFIPVYAFLFIPLRIAIAGDTENYLARTSMIQWALMICVFCVSHAPALLMLDIPGYEGQNIKLLMFLILVTQLSDVFQYVFGKTLGKHKIAPKVSPNKTWEGFVGGIGTAVAVGTGLWWITPFNPLQTALIALSITLAGFAGGLCMSAIKRDRGVKDFGTIIEGHGGMLDRIDSICFAAPIYFHIIRYFFTI